MPLSPQTVRPPIVPHGVVPLIAPPAGWRGQEPHSPVRDDGKLGPTEDLERMPDGVPHSVVGLTAFFSVLLALLVAFMLGIDHGKYRNRAVRGLAGGTITRAAAVVLAVIAIPVLVSTLRRKADNDRDHQHPSR